MILRRLRMVNYRKFRRAEIAFPEGLVGIVGPNGSGKSTIFEAAAWALYGNRMSRTGGFGISSTAAGRGAPCSVDLEFERDGRAFRVMRRLTHGGEFTSAQVFEGGALLASGGSAAEAALRRIVGLDAPVFLKTVFARQGELSGLARDTLGYRRRLIEGLLELDLLDRVRGQVAADRRGLKPEGGAGLEPLIETAGREVRRLREEWEEAAREVKALEERGKQDGALRSGIGVLERERSALVRGLEDRRRAIEALGRPPPGPAVGESALAKDLGEVRGRARAGSLQLARLSKCLQVMKEAAGARCPVCGGPLSPEAGRRLEEDRRKLLERVEALGVAERKLADQWREASRAGRRERDRAALEREVACREADLAALDGRLARLRDDVARLAFDEAAHAGAQARWKELNSAVMEAASRKAALDARLGPVRRLDDRRRAAELRCLEELLEAFRGERVAGFLPALDRECSGLLASATEGRYSKVQLDRDFNVRMEDGGRSYVIGRFSGGEQDLACLALRLGLLRLMTARRPVEFAVLDEIFGSQDRPRRRSVLRALGRLCPPFRQVFVVTHAEDVQELLPAVLRVRGEGTVA